MWYIIFININHDFTDILQRYEIDTTLNNNVNESAETDVGDGGVDMPDGGDGITRYPQDATGSFIPADDLEGSDGVNNKGDNNGGN